MMGINEVKETLIMISSNKLSNCKMIMMPTSYQIPIRCIIIIKLMIRIKILIPTFNTMLMPQISPNLKAVILKDFKSK